ncbi:hypothetical protein FD755_005998 [Muntiacus reevesi]|uniref:Uncharacterized protein n=1 Tax=Muntiacus reevesi TaxID=9886 RepID=A0A5J5MU73_MUNRE|nr:hypothetical protein FD755_005998 [Muntiacus reevesi]
MSKPTVAGMGCPGGRFPSLQGCLEESLSLKNGSCSSRPFPGPPDLRQLQLVLMLQVLGAVAHSSLVVVLDQPLRVRVLALPRAGLPPRGRLHPWRHLQETASVPFNPFHLLIRDLRGVANGDLRV